MTTDSMVEKMARAIYEASGASGPFGRALGPPPEIAVKRHIPLAAAALDVLRNPNMAMVGALQHGIEATTGQRLPVSILTILLSDVLDAALDMGIRPLPPNPGSSKE